MDKMPKDYVKINFKVSIPILKLIFYNEFDQSLLLCKVDE